MFRLRACTIAILLAASPLFAQDDADLARFLPAETPFFFEVRNPTLAEMKRMATYACLEDPRLKSVMERLFGEDGSFTTSKFDLGPARVSIGMDMSRPDVSVSVTYADAAETRSFRISQRFAVAWLGLTDDPLPVDVVASLQIDGGCAAALETFKRILAAGVIAATHPKQPPTVDEVRQRIYSEFDVQGVACTEATFDKIKIYLAPVGKFLVVTTAKPRLVELIERSRNGAETSLANDSRFTGMLKRADGDGTPMTIIYLQVDRAIDAIQGQQPQPAAYARLFLAQFGLNGLEGFTSVSRADGAGVSSTTSIRLGGTGPRRGLGRLFETGPKPTLSCLEFAPRDSLYAGTGTFDLRGMYDIACQLGGMVVAMGEDKFRQATGLGLRADLLDTLGGEAGVIVSTNRGVLPDLGLVLKVKDGARLEQSILKLLAEVDWPAGCGPVSFKVHGVQAYTVPLAHPGLLEFPLAPTFGIVDDHLLVTPYPITFQRFAGVKKGVRPSLAQNRDFAKLRERVPEDALGVSYLDVARVVELAYDTCIPLLQSLPPQPGMNAQYELPDVEIFSSRLYGRVGWRTADENGMYWHAHSSIDTSGVLLGLVGAGVGAWATVRGEVPVEPRVAVRERPVMRGNLEARECESRTRIIRARLIGYVQEHGKLPDSLDELRAKHVRPESFLVPGHDKPYVYLGPAGKGGILLHGYPNGNDQRICVITTDLRMQRISAQELEKQLASAPGQGPR